MIRSLESAALARPNRISYTGRNPRFRNRTILRLFAVISRRFDPDSAMERLPANFRESARIKFYPNPHGQDAFQHFGPSCCPISKPSFFRSALDQISIRADSRKFAGRISLLRNLGLSRTLRLRVFAGKPALAFTVSCVPAKTRRRKSRTFDPTDQPSVIGWIPLRNLGSSMKVRIQISRLRS